MSKLLKLLYTSPAMFLLRTGAWPVHCLPAEPLSRLPPCAAKGQTLARYKELPP